MMARRIVALTLAALLALTPVAWGKWQSVLQVAVSGGGGGACALWTTWSSGLTLDATHQTQSQNVICGGVTDGWMAKCDLFYLFANQNSTAALKDVIAGTTTALSATAPTFTTDRGFAGNGTSATINVTGYNYSTGTNFVQNAASKMAWSLESGVDNGYLVGGSSNFSTSNVLQSFSFSSTGATTINGATSLSTSTLSTGLGMFVGSRTSATQVDIYQNAGNVGTSAANASTTVTSQNPWFLGQLGIAFFGGTIAAGAVCGGLTGTDVTNMYGRLHPYMQVIAGQP